MNLIITEMRKNCTSLQEKLIKEEVDKSVRKILNWSFEIWKKIWKEILIFENVF